MSLLGWLTVMLGVLVPVVLGIGFGHRALKRPDMHPVCGVALLVCLYSVLGQLIVPVLRRVIEEEAVEHVVVLGLRFVCTGGLVTAFFMAIVGLVGLGRSRGRYARGRRSAVWAMVLSVIFLAMSALWLAGSVADFLRPIADEMATPG